MGSGNMPAMVQQDGEFGAVMLIRDPRVSIQYGFEPLGRVAGSVPDPGQLFKMAGDLAFVPSGHDRIDIRKVFVKRGPSDADRLGDLGHRHRGKPVPMHEACSRLQRRSPYGIAVGRYRLVPQFGHTFSLGCAVRPGSIKTLCIVK